MEKELKYEPTAEEIQKAEEMTNEEAESRMTDFEKSSSNEREQFVRKEKLAKIINENLIEEDKLCFSKGDLIEAVRGNIDIMEAEQFISLVNKGMHEEDESRGLRIFLYHWGKIKGAESLKSVLRNIPEEIARKYINEHVSNILGKISIINLIDLIE